MERELTRVFQGEEIRLFQRAFFAQPIGAKMSGGAMDFRQFIWRDFAHHHIAVVVHPSLGFRNQNQLFPPLPSANKIAQSGL